jgi:aerotaxis receptor
LAKAREFALHEMFFSTTDSTGRILAGNKVFSAVSGFTQEELVGQPHNVIRHPDMPRAAFAVLWSNLRERKPFNGYVKNMAKDGSYYWVFASISTLRSGEHLSVRFKPTSAQFLSDIPPLYARALAAEKKVVAEGGSERAACDAGLDVLGAALASSGYASYDEFSEAALTREMLSRDHQLREQESSLFPDQIASDASAEAKRSYLQSIRRYSQACELFKSLERIERLSHLLRTEAGSVISLAEEFRLSALNSNIASSKLGHEGACISAIATFLTSYATGMTQDTGSIRNYLNEIASSARTINASVAMARLELEMILFFKAELANDPSLGENKLLPQLEESFDANTSTAGKAISTLAAALPPVSSSRDMLAQAVVSIQMAQVRGLTEAARIKEGAALMTMFEEFRGKTRKARVEIDKISEVLSDFTAMLVPMGKCISNLSSAGSLTNKQRHQTAVG